MSWGRGASKGVHIPLALTLPTSLPCFPPPGTDPGSGGGVPVFVCLAGLLWSGPQEQELCCGWDGSAWICSWRLRAQGDSLQSTGCLRQDGMRCWLCLPPSILERLALCPGTPKTQKAWDLLFGGRLGRGGNHRITRLKVAELSDWGPLSLEK